ncbi:geranylgeranylglycerol-phosphate geranylgeranyltransferase [Crocinitomicaceae bacterium]|nr:geranylgeranylglycerol-phosphate geranylgeranyltransferase [Crocinitomicaceae bacterium]
MIHFIRLTRPLNLFVIALTMYGLGWYFNDFIATSEITGVYDVDFFLLVFSTLLIAAAGNIINDYFDVRADRINKPHQLIIDVYVKRRIAIVTHWALNILAFGIAVFLSWRLETFWYVFIHLLSINLLWYYSSNLKRKFLIGNIIIAGLTAMVPILVGIYFFQCHQLGNTEDFIYQLYPLTQFEDASFILWFSFALAGFAFLFNLAREIVKDMEDMDGDKLLRAKTVPIVLGLKKTKLIIGSVLAAAIFAIPLFSAELQPNSNVTLIPIGCAALLAFISAILLIRAKEKMSYKLINTCLKLAMVFGLLSPVFWKLIFVYA